MIQLLSYLFFCKLNYHLRPNTSLSELKMRHCEIISNVKVCKMRQKRLFDTWLSQYVCAIHFYMTIQNLAVFCTFVSVVPMWCRGCDWNNNILQKFYVQITRFLFERVWKWAKDWLWFHYNMLLRCRKMGRVGNAPKRSIKVFLRWNY